jgi:hypothetical protein
MVGKRLLRPLKFNNNPNKIKIKDLIKKEEVMEISKKIDNSIKVEISESNNNLLQMLHQPLIFRLVKMKTFKQEKLRTN